MINEYVRRLERGDSGQIVIGPDGNLCSPSPSTTALGRVTPAAAFSQYSTGSVGASPWAIITLWPDGNLWSPKWLRLAIRSLV